MHDSSFVGFPGMQQLRGKWLLNYVGTWGLWGVTRVLRAITITWPELWER